MKIKKVNLIKFIISMLVILVLIFPFDNIGFIFPKFLVDGIYVNIKYVIAGTLFFVVMLLYIVFERKISKDEDVQMIVSNVTTKVLLAVSLIVLSVFGFVHPLIVSVIVMMQMFSLGFSSIVSLKTSKVPCVKIENYQTIFLMLGIFLTLFYNLPFELVGLNISKYFLFVGAFLSVASAIQCYNLSKKHLK